ncbi:MAG: hypothetical protein KL863_09025 [Rhizobium sp.]|nr:hypothetical protein [Rhizobium sp.]
MDISLESNLAEWTKDLREHQREHVPFATALALTWTANDMKAEHARLLPLVFDRPTRFTMNSLQATPATKQRQRSSVFFRESNTHKYGRHYLMPQVQGGTRPHKRFEYWLIRKGIMASDEFAVPARGSKLDSFGNISSGTIVQILSQLEAGPDATQWQTARSKKRAGPSRSVYFVAPDNAGWKRGIWRRSGKRIEPVLLFLKNIRYEQRYAFFEISRQVAVARLPQNFRDALARALASASSKASRTNLPDF